jgi:hypothetical protein
MTISQSTTIRADTVESLRPAGLHSARRCYAAGEINAAALRTVEDEAIAGIINYQEALGLPVVTDGEFRRENWWRHLEGVKIVDGDAAAFAKNEAPRMCRNLFELLINCGRSQSLWKTSNFSQCAAARAPASVKGFGGFRLLSCSRQRLRGETCGLGSLTQVNGLQTMRPLRQAR